MLIFYSSSTRRILGADCKPSAIDRLYSADRMMKYNRFPIYYAAFMVLRFQKKVYIQALNHSFISKI